MNALEQEIMVRATELMKAVAHLQGFRIMADTIGEMRLGDPHAGALLLIRAAARRSEIGLITAVLDGPRSDRASVAQLLELLREDHQARGRLFSRSWTKIEATRQHREALKSDRRLRDLRCLRNSLAHIGDVDEVQHELSSLADETIQCALTLFEALGLETDYQDHVQRFHNNADVFRQTYLRGAGKYPDF